MGDQYERDRLNVRIGLDYFLGLDTVDVSLPDGNILTGGKVLYIADFESEDVLVHEILESPRARYNDQTIVKYEDIDSLLDVTIGINIAVRWIFLPHIQASIFDDDLYTPEYMKEYGIEFISFFDENDRFLFVRRIDEDFTMTLNKSKNVGSIMISFDLFNFNVGGQCTASYQKTKQKT